MSQTLKETLPAAPGDLDLLQLFGGIHWHQRWEIFQGVYTPGHNPVAFLCDSIGLPRDLRGLRILDVGAWNGCFSFECERRGAREIVALSLEDPQTTGFQRLHQCLNSRVHYRQQSIYTIEKDDLGEFDLILFLGVLYHLRYPLLALDKLRTVCRGTVLLESFVIDEAMQISGWCGTKTTSLKKLHRELTRIPLWRFFREGELAGDRSNWFGPNIQAVLEALESAGFSALLLQQWGDRAAFSARVKTGLGQSLSETYEAWEGNRKFIGF